MVKIIRQEERELVLKPCIKLCRKLKQQGYILKWRRLDALDFYHESGDPDIEIWISNHDILIIIMAECKKPDGGKLSKVQEDYRDKYKNLKNVIYVEIRNITELNTMIMKIADNQYFKPEDFKKFMETSIHSMPEMVPYDYDMGKLD